MELGTYRWIMGSVAVLLIAGGLVLWVWWYGKRQREEEGAELRRLTPLPEDLTLSGREIHGPFGRPAPPARLPSGGAPTRRILRQPVVTAPAASVRQFPSRATATPVIGDGDEELDIDLGVIAHDAAEATAAGVKIVGAAAAGVVAALATAGKTGDPAVCQRPDAATEELGDDAGDAGDQQPKGGGLACAVADDSGSVGNDPDPERVDTPD